MERVPAFLEDDALGRHQAIAAARLRLIDEHLGVERVDRRVDDLRDIGEMLAHGRAETLVVGAEVELLIAAWTGRTDVVELLRRLANARERIARQGEAEGHAGRHDGQPDRGRQESSPSHQATSTVSS